MLLPAVQSLCPSPQLHLCLLSPLPGRWLGSVKCSYAVDPTDQSSSGFATLQLCDPEQVLNLSEPQFPHL